MLAELRSAFERRFRQPPAVAARAPGRVNLIGEHTDYNEGLVLPAAIDRDTRVLAARAPGRQVRVLSRERGEGAGFDPGAPERRGDWLDYVQAPFFALSERGLAVSGCDLALATELPLESGLSSSAALGLALVTALDALFELGLDPETRCRVAHRGESEFVGVGCGIMDPYASGLGRRDAALRIDCRSLALRYVPLPGAEVRLLVAHSGVRRALARAGYRERVEECRRALRAAIAAGVAPPDATALRDLEPSDLPALERALAPVLFRRVRHVVTENARVDATCDALAAGDLPGAGALLRAGMRSLRDDYEVSTPELDALCAIADAQPGVYGSRLTGAGFGGCTLHLVATDAVSALAEALAVAFAARFGRRPPLLVVRPAPGAERLDP